ncbi:PDZ domain-containing protein [Paenibacillaceae bacterium]|nr:PDZ domain-containing protein [Paenibacillaceae bacterium]
MNERNNGNSYDEFFNRRRSEEDQDQQEQEQDRHADNMNSQDRSKAEEKPSYYYSYGPFKPGGDNPTGGGEERESSQSFASDKLVQREDVHITPPTSPRNFAPVAPAQTSRSGNGGSGASGGWQVREKRRSSFKAMFASFMAGVIVIGSLMAVADYQNWFTSSGILAPKETGSNGAVKAGESGGTDNSVRTVAGTNRPDNIAQIFEQASPAVVKITTYAKVQSSSRELDPFFRQFFGDNYNAPESNGNEDGLVENGLGSGFFFDESGYILTNQHVVADSAKIEVTVQGFPKKFEAELLGSSYDLDLAVLKVKGDESFPTLSLGDSDSIEIGDWVVAIGNPHGFDHTVTVGVLSSKERPISIPDSKGTRNYEHLLQTDASINPGNSGGPLLNTNGEVIGINTAVSTSAQGIGFAIPTSTIKNVLENLKENKEIPKKPLPFIGVVLSELTEELSQQLGLDNTDGALVKEVYYKSPAYNGDVRQFDVIVGVDGQSIPGVVELQTAIKEKAVGDNVTLNVIRDGKKLDLPIEIGDSNTYNLPQNQVQR